MVNIQEESSQASSLAVVFQTLTHAHPKKMTDAFKRRLFLYPVNFCDCVSFFLLLSILFMDALQRYESSSEDDDERCNTTQIGKRSPLAQKEQIVKRYSVQSLH